MSTSWSVGVTARLVVAAMSLTACQWGTRPPQFAVANEAAGAQVAVRVTSESRDRVGELLAVDSGGLYLRTTRLTHIAWTRVRALDVAQLDSPFDLPRGRRPDEALTQRLALVSRFRSLSPALLQRVLQEIRQDTLDHVR